MAWFRWHEGTSSDPKFHLIARKSGQPVAFALAIWAMLLERASAAEVRGDVSGFDCESADVALGMPDGATQAIYDAMVAKGMVVDGRIAKWEERQPKKEDATSTERVREHRAKQKAKFEFASNEVKRQETQCNEVKRQETQCNEVKRQETQCNEVKRQETQCNEVKRQETQCNEVKRQETQCNEVKRQETPDKIRKEYYIKPPLPPHAGGERDLQTSGEEAPAEEPDKVPEQEPGEEPRLVAKSGKVLAGKTLEDFERFWREFGLSRGKAEAADAWLEIPDMTDALVARICEAAKQEAADRPRLEGRGQKPKQARGWLLSRRWEDYAPIKPRVPDKEQPSFGGDFDEEKWKKAQEMRRKLETEKQARRMASG